MVFPQHPFFLALRGYYADTSQGFRFIFSSCSAIFFASFSFATAPTPLTFFLLAQSVLLTLGLYLFAASYRKVYSLYWPLSLVYFTTMFYCVQIIFW